MAVDSRDGGCQVVVSLLLRWWLSLTCGVVWWLSLTRGVACEVVENGRGWWAVENVAYTQPCHRPVTRQNGDGDVTGDFVLTCPRPRDSRTHDPARVQIPVSITTRVQPYL